MKAGLGQAAAGTGAAAPGDGIIVRVDKPAAATQHSSQIPSLCRVCHQPETDAHPLISLRCGCEGDAGRAHKDCAAAWRVIRRNSDNKCERCGHTLSRNGVPAGDLRGVIRPVRTNTNTNTNTNPNTALSPMQVTPPQQMSPTSPQARHHRRGSSFYGRNHSIRILETTLSQEIVGNSDAAWNMAGSPPGLLPGRPTRCIDYSLYKQRLRQNPVRSIICAAVFIVVVVVYIVFFAFLYTPPNPGITLPLILLPALALVAVAGLIIVVTACHQ